MKKTLLLIVFLFVCLTAAGCGSALVVDSAGDEPDSNLTDGVCKTVNNNCTLRAAIMEADLSDDISKITFANVTQINPTSALPLLTAGNTHINGEGLVTLDGSNINENSISGILIRDSSANIIQGLKIQNFWFGITINSHQGSSTHNIIGLLNTGPGDGSKRNIIILNKVGIKVSGINASKNTISGNYIGMNGDGQTPGSNEFGVSISSDAHDNLIGSISGTGVSQGWNLISGNSEAGIYLSEGFQNHITGNYIGTNLAGTSAVGNFDGIRITNGSKNNIIGISSSGEGNLNLISGNLRNGIDIMDQDSYTNVIAGNFIGTNFDGSSALGNGWSGITNKGDANRIGTNGDGSYDQLETNVISGNGTTGINLSSNGNQVSGNMIGVDSTGLVGIGNALSGISVNGSDNLIGSNGDGVADEDERNVISANAVNDTGSAGIAIFGNINIVAGNYIGTDVTGNAALGNLYNGISLHSFANWNLIGTDGDGVADDREGNLISGNGRTGINLSGAAHNTISGNLIGTDKSGTLAIPNGHTGNEFGGIRITNSSFSNVIGTDGDGIGDTIEGNLISGNAGRGVKIDGPNTQNIIVAGNYIGTDISGISALGNYLGIEISNGSSYNRIGTNADGSSDIAERNLISSNSGPGIFIGGSHNQIAGNYIGTGKFGVSGLGNGSNGINVIDNTTENDIGGSNNKANIIAFNHGFGIVLFGMNSDKVQILNNSIFSNEKSGIALADEADTWLPFNDPGDIDIGPNDLMNFPELTKASSLPTTVSITGQITNGLPGTAFTIELFDNDVCDTPAPFGEGKTFITSIYLTTDMSGNASFSASINAVIPAGHFITATATTDKKTSEFSECIEVTEGQVTYSQELEESPCDQFNEDEMSLMTFEVRPESGLFVLYVKNPAPFPVVGPEDADWEYYASLGDTTAKCGFEGFEDRVYCYFYIPETYYNTIQPLKLNSNLCIPPFYVDEEVSIFAKGPDEPASCQEDLGPRACPAAGGTYLASTGKCNCP